MSAICLIFFFNDTATTEIYTLSLHDALPILAQGSGQHALADAVWAAGARAVGWGSSAVHRRAKDMVLARSEEHTSELQSQSNLVCRLLLEKKKTIEPDNTSHAGQKDAGGRV